MEQLAHMVSEEIDPKIPTVLPHDKVYTIQVGYKMFRLSGASLLSDAPSYFTAFFGQDQNEDKVLFIDRSPTVFDKIYSHLQGYHISSDSELEYLYLVLDAYYFCLRRLQQVMIDESPFATIGPQTFRLPRSLLSLSGNYPNYFLMHYETLLTDNKRLIVSKQMIRPPPQRAVGVANRSPLLFADLLEVLRGNHLVIRDDEHRELLVKECRYYRFLELEQRILKHRIIHNPYSAAEEIVLELGNISQKGVKNVSTDMNDEQPIQYARPYMQKEPNRILIVQVKPTADSDLQLVLNRRTNLAVIAFHNRLASSMGHIFKDIGRSFKEDIKEGKLMILCRLSESTLVINGMELKENWWQDFLSPEDDDTAKRHKSELEGDYVTFKLCRLLFKIYQRKDKCLVHVVLLEGLSGPAFFNKTIKFL